MDHRATELQDQYILPEQTSLSLRRIRIWESMETKAGLLLLGLLVLHSTSVLSCFSFTWLQCFLRCIFESYQLLFSWLLRLSCLADHERMRYSLRFHSLVPFRRFHTLNTLNSGVLAHQELLEYCFCWILGQGCSLLSWSQWIYPRCFFAWRGSTSFYLWAHIWWTSWRLWFREADVQFEWRSHLGTSVSYRDLASENRRAKTLLSLFLGQACQITANRWFTTLYFADIWMWLFDRY